MLKLLFSRQWWWSTLLVIAAVLVMIRLGIWQLDRLSERRAFNARVVAQLAAPPLALTGAALDADLVNMEYRSVVVTGTYDLASQVALRNTAWQSEAGVNLLTPLRIAGSERAVLVDRGWIPLADRDRAHWAAYDQPGEVQVTGWLRRSQQTPDFGFASDPTPTPGKPTALWNLVNVAYIAMQVSEPLLPVWIQLAEDPARSAPPYPSQPELDLTEGPHMGYALQWFSFAALLGLGYPLVYLRKKAKG
jgi:surfeit locus 1 family protein